jgi:hypothetical protein
MAVFPLGAQLPHQGRDAEDDDAEDGRVGLPVGRLRIPTTGRRPDVLGVAKGGVSVRIPRCDEAIEAINAFILRRRNSRNLSAAALQKKRIVSKLQNQLGGKYIPL